MRHTLFALLTALSLAVPAFGGEGSPPPANPTVLMSPVALPIVVDGHLVNYIFVTLRLGLSPNADAVKLRAMEPYFRDALVRVGHRTPFVRPDNYAALDDAKLKAAVVREASAVAGPGLVVSAQVVREQPQHVAGLPKPAVPTHR